MKTPSFSLVAVGTTRHLAGPPGPGVPLLLIFHGHAGAGTVTEINVRVRDRWPTVEQLVIASVVDLHHIPCAVRSSVELTLSAAYREAAKQVPEHLDPTEHVIILPDWDGAVTAAFAMQERINDVGLVVVTSQWTIFERYTGLEPVAAAMRIVADAIDAESGHAQETTAPS